MKNESTKRFPLAWPAERDRTPAAGRTAAKFRAPFDAAYNGLVDEIERLGGADVAVSCNLPLRPDGLPIIGRGTFDRLADPGVAVHFRRGEGDYVIACDGYTQVRWNLRAIAVTVAALRTIQRHGATGLLEQAIDAFALGGRPVYRAIGQVSTIAAAQAQAA